MWIIPKNYQQSSVSAQDMVGSKEDLTLLGSSIESSVMWRSKPTPLRIWSRKWNQVSWIPHLFGRTLKPSLHTCFQTELQSSLAVIHANHFQQQVNDKAQMIPDTCGPTSDNTFKPSDQNELFSRMSKDTYRLDSQQSSAIWKKMVSQQRGDYLARKKLAHHTEESECSSWPTPTAANNGPGLDRENPRGIQQGNALATAVAWKNLGWWGTPRSCTSMAATLTEKLAQHKHPNLETQVAKEMWATPNTMDHLPQRSKEALIRQAQTTRKGRTKPSNLREQVNPEAIEIYKAVNYPTPRANDYKGAQSVERVLSKGRNPMTNNLPDAINYMDKCSPQDQTKNSTTGSTAGLNPNWVESLMGIPTGWTDLGCWEME